MKDYRHIYSGGNHRSLGKIDHSGMSDAFLNPNMTIDGVTKTPTLRYVASDATASALPANGYGEDLVKTGANPITVGKNTPFLNSLSSAVSFPVADGYYQAGNNNFADIDGQDVVIEFIARATALDWDHVFTKADFGGTGYGYSIYTHPVGSTISYIVYASDATGLAYYISGAACLNAWLHMIIFVKKGSALGFYIGGVAAGAANDTIPSWSNTSAPAMIGSRNDAVNGFVGDLAYYAMWEGTSWLSTHLQADVARERASLLTGNTAQFHAFGSNTPAVL